MHNFLDYQKVKFSFKWNRGEKFPLLKISILTASQMADSQRSDSHKTDSNLADSHLSNWLIGNLLNGIKKKQHWIVVKNLERSHYLCKVYYICSMSSIVI